VRPSLLSLTVRWVALLSASLTFALPPGVGDEDFVQLTVPQAKEVLGDFRASRLNGDVCFKFEVIHKPRRGDSAPPVPGVVWAGWSPEGPRVRVELRPTNGAPAVAFIATKSAQGPRLWLRRGDLTVENPRADEPLAPGLLLLPSDLALPYTHWEDTRYVKTERSRGRPVHFFLATNPAKAEPTKVTFALDRTYGALVQATYLDAAGAARRTLQVEEFSKVDEQWILGSCSVRDEATRDVDLLRVTEAAVGRRFDAATFDPATLARPAPTPADLKPL
jgi:hypothetical protein